MRLEIDPRSPIPPSEQLAEQVRFAVSSGRLRAGDRLPSVRGLAADAAVNPNTVSKAYRDLAREGILEARQGDGVFVAAAAPTRCASHRDRVLRERLSVIVDDACAAGWSADQLLEAVQQCVGRKAPRFAASALAARAGGKR